MYQPVPPKAPAGLVAMALAWLLLLSSALIAAPAHARKECRPSEAAEEPQQEAGEDRWPHDVQYDWHHASGDDDWVHARSGGRVHESEEASWVHDTDYGWWAAVPDAAVRELEDEAAPGPIAEDEDCTVSRERNECVVLANQIARYTFQVALAERREDDLWEASLRDTIDRLELRGARYECPWVEPSLQEKVRVTLEEVVKAVGVASQVAAMLYRMGLF